jgi:hypothetical protein
MTFEQERTGGDEDIDDLALHDLCVYGDEEQREVATEDNNAV